MGSFDPEEISVGPKSSIIVVVITLILGGGAAALAILAMLSNSLDAAFATKDTHGDLFRL